MVVGYLHYPGIYFIKSKSCEMIYIGQTSKTIKARLKQHLYHLREGSHSSYNLQEKFCKEGSDSLSFGIITCIMNPLLVENFILLSLEYFAMSKFEVSQLYNSKILRPSKLNLDLTLKVVPDLHKRCLRVKSSKFISKSSIPLEVILL